MINEKKLREWATPLTIGAFVLTATTGILMFFKMNFGLVNPVHEWFSWLLVFGGATHLLLNWRACVRYASQPVGRSILILFLVLICVALLPVGGKHERRPSNKIFDALIQAPLSAVAQVVKHDSDEVINDLRSKGIQTESKEQTIGEIAEKNNKSATAVLEAVLGTGAEMPVKQ